MAKVEDKYKEIKQMLESDRLVIGTERTMKLLKQGKLELVYLSSNCPDDIKTQVMHYSKMSQIETKELDIPNDDLGVLCRKPFMISMIGLLRNGN